jgi:hypothetical protein
MTDGGCRSGLGLAWDTVRNARAFRSCPAPRVHAPRPWLYGRATLEPSRGRFVTRNLPERETSEKRREIRARVSGSCGRGGSCVSREGLFLIRSRGPSPGRHPPPQRRVRPMTKSQFLMTRQGAGRLKVPNSAQLAGLEAARRPAQPAGHRRIQRPGRHPVQRPGQLRRQTSVQRARQVAVPGRVWSARRASTPAPVRLPGQVFLSMSARRSAPRPIARGTCCRRQGEAYNGGRRQFDCRLQIADCKLQIADCGLPDRCRQEVR